MRRLFISIAIGVVATIAIAWVSAVSQSFWPDDNQDMRWGKLYDKDTNVTWQIKRYHGFGATRIDAMPRAGPFMVGMKSSGRNVIATSKDVSWQPDFESIPELFSDLDIEKMCFDRITMIDGRGWPFLALWCRFERRHNPSKEYCTIRTGGIQFRGDWGGPSSALPLWPLWRGLLADTGIFATMAFVALFVVFHTRRRSRQRKGQCPTCGYYLGPRMQEGCPECGWNRVSGPIQQEQTQKVS